MSRAKSAVSNSQPLSFENKFNLDRQIIIQEEVKIYFNNTGMLFDFRNQFGLKSTQRKMLMLILSMVYYKDPPPPTLRGGGGLYVESSVGGFFISCSGKFQNILEKSLYLQWVGLNLVLYAPNPNISEPWSHYLYYAYNNQIYVYININNQ